MIFYIRLDHLGQPGYGTTISRHVDDGRILTEEPEPNFSVNQD